MPDVAAITGPELSSSRAAAMTDMPLADLFPTPTEAEWRALVDKALRGGDFERRLVSRTADGLAIRPLYRRQDTGGIDWPLPGSAPLTRGATPAGARQGWDIRQRHAEPDPATANAGLIEDLAGGVTSITLGIEAPGTAGLPYHQADIARALDGVRLDACPVHLDAGEYTPDAAGSLMAVWRAAGLAPERMRGGFGYDPLSTLAATGSLYHPLPKALAIAADLVATALTMPGVSALAADGHRWHAAGASEAQELAAVLATLVAYLRAAEAKGIGPAAALPRIAVSLAADADQFLGVAKLRAARRLVWRLADACGAGDAASRVSVAAVTAERMLARRDPWVNMLRTTMASAAAAMGGADAITVLPFTWALGRPDAFARRIARNTHLVLMEESGLGRVADPAGGSWYVERATAELAATAWQAFQAIEARGGLGAALASGWWQGEVLRVAEARAKAIATGRQELTGASAFPRLGDDGVEAAAWPAPLAADLPGARVAPTPLRRLAEPFEALRDKADLHARRTGRRPTVFLASLGPLAAHSTRTTWLRNFLAAGGIDASGGGDGFTSSTDAGRAFAGSGETVACLCSSDAVYGELAEATASLLKTAGAGRLYLAGRPREQEVALEAAGVDGFIFAGIDAVATLARLQEELGVR